LYPNILSAAGFQDVIVPSRVFATIASLDDLTMVAMRTIASCPRRPSVTTAASTSVERGCEAQKQLQQESESEETRSAECPTPAQSARKAIPESITIARHGFALTESERHPHEDRYAQEVQRVALETRRQPAPEQRDADEGDGDEEHERFPDLLAAPTDAGVVGPQEDQGRHDQDPHRASPSHHVVQTSPVTGRPQGSHQVQADRSHRRGHRGADGAGQQEDLQTSPGRSKSWRAALNRSTRYPPRTASKALPVAMPIDTKRPPDVWKLTRKAPRKTPGHTFRPNRSTAARATPDAGQTAEALALTTAK
jgi:hypothetical protein